MVDAWFINDLTNNHILPLDNLLTLVTLFKYECLNGGIANLSLITLRGLRDQYHFTLFMVFKLKKYR
jgi:hypothetical protein